MNKPAGKDAAPALSWQAAQQLTVKISAAAAGTAFAVDAWLGGVLGLLLGSALGGATLLFLLVIGDTRWSLHLLDDGHCPRGSRN